MPALLWPALQLKSMPKLWKPDDFEKGARQRKAFAPDYRENFQEPAVQKKHPAPYRLVGNYLKFHTSIVSGEIRERLHENIRRAFETETFKIVKTGRLFKKSWSPKMFAEANGLPKYVATADWRASAKRFEELSKFVFQRIKRASPITISEYDNEERRYVSRIEIQVTIGDLLQLQEDPSANSHQNPSEEGSNDSRGSMP